MHRFKASKYKNSVVKCSKKEECFTDISVEVPLCFGNGLAVGARFIASNISSAGSGKIGIFGVNHPGRMGQNPTLSAHGDSVIDLEWSPFHHNMLLSASQDTTVKLWKLPYDGLSESSPINPVATFTGFKKRPELLRHHTIADNTFAVTDESGISIWNIDKGISMCGKEDFGFDLVQSISWSQDGNTIACTTKGKKVVIYDPRSNKVVQEGKAHDNHKDSRVVSLGSSNKLATTGFSNSRSRQLRALDQRNLSSCLQTLEFGSSTGVLMPFFDPDTNLLFLCGKGDSSINILEVGPDEITQASHAMLPDQTKGMSMAPKVCLDVMGCEVDRLLQLCSRQIVPVRIEVPRRSKIDFAAEIFPDTDSDDIVLTSDSWFEGQNAKRLKTSLDPSRRKSLRSDDESGNDVSKTSSPVKNIASEPVERVAAPAVKKEEVQKSKAVESKPESKPRSAAKPFPGVRQCKFRHWTGTVLHPSTHITAITKLSHTIPGGSDGFHANDRYAAVPLTTPGGHVGIIELAKVGRITGDVPSFQNTSPVTDFRWDPFDDRQLAVGLDDGLVKIWRVPDEGLSGTLSEPVQVLGGHYSKILCMRYHPLASNILATASLDMNVLIWNAENDEPALELGGHSEEVLAMEWSTDGKYMATVSKDNKIRIYDPRNSSSPIKEGPGPKGSRGARIVWTCADKMLFVSGFSGSGGRSLSIHSVDDLTKGPLAEVNMDNSPATLIPHYDEDSATVFLAGRGDALMYSYEISSEDPYLTQLATFKSDQVYQGFSFLSKLKSDPRQVEFARAWRLSKTSLEPISFKVPRVKMEYFQDDLFPDTRETGVPTMTADGWLSGKNMLPRLVSLKPAGMKPLSQAPKEEPKERKYESYNPDTYKTDEEKKEELLAAMSNKLDLDKALEQDTMEGVDEDEWDD